MLKGLSFNLFFQIELRADILLKYPPKIKRCNEHTRKCPHIPE